MKGTVLFYNNERGFGFIKQEEGENIFFHISSCAMVPKEGMKVIYATAEGTKGTKAVCIQEDVDL